MNVTAAKQKLIRAGATLGNSDRPLKQQLPLSATIGEMSSLAAMLNADNPAQAEILNKAFSAMDELKLSEQHWEKAKAKIEDAYVLLVQNEKASAI